MSETHKFTYVKTIEFDTELNDKYGTNKDGFEKMCSDLDYDYTTVTLHMLKNGNGACTGFAIESTGNVQS